LRSEGLKHIEKISRNLWTDYNTHDPGITMLEALCYAITDFGNRVQLPVPDLLEGNDTASLPTAKQILTTSPVSESDYRKILIDIEGVNNAFIRPSKKQMIYTHCLKKTEAEEDFPQGKLSYEENLGEHYDQTSQFHLKGLNNILFEPVKSVQMLNDNQRKEKLEQITNEIKKVYHSNRNLCEDLSEVSEVGYFDIVVCGDFEIETAANANEVMANWLFRIQKHLAPSINRYNLEQLLNLGKDSEEIFEGPVLKNGFILNEELEKANFKNTVHLSDLIRITKETPGVKRIKKIHVKQFVSGNETSEANNNPDEKNKKWTLCFPPDHNKVLRLQVDSSNRRTNLYKDVVPVPVQPERVKKRLVELQTAYEEAIQLSYDDFPVEKGKRVDTGVYTSIQNDLPQTYGTGENGLSPSLPPERHAKALQLKGYLLFFDQILASYFSHLKNLGTLLSSDPERATYFANNFLDEKDKKLLKYETTHDQDLKDLFNGLDARLKRKNGFLDHLMARFAENISDHAFMLLEHFQDDVDTALLWHKANFLKTYPQMSYRRFQSFNYHSNEDAAWDTTNVSGLKERLSGLLATNNLERRDLLNDPEEEGMFLFENILLRPEKGDNDQFMDICMKPDCTQCAPHDPYSLRLTIVLPGWSKRFSNMYFREFAENLIRKEVPAHILVRVCWVAYKAKDENGKPAMLNLQNHYRKWLMHKMSHPDKQKENKHLKPLIDSLHHLETIYPQGVLHDCEDKDEQHSSIILGKSKIGVIKEKKQNDE
jgi:hypothetical protein